MPAFNRNDFSLKLYFLDMVLRFFHAYIFIFVKCITFRLLYSRVSLVSVKFQGNEQNFLFSSKEIILFSNLAFCHVWWPRRWHSVGEVTGVAVHSAKSLGAKN